MLVLFYLLLLIPSMVFGYIFFLSKNRRIGITALLWLLYVVYEAFYILGTCPGNCIRVDIVFIWPVLIILSIIAIFDSLKFFKIIKESKTKPKSHIYILILVVLLIPLLAFVAWATVTTKEYEETTRKYQIGKFQIQNYTPDPSFTTDSQTILQKTYRDLEFNFSISFPDTWEVERNIQPEEPYGSIYISMPSVDEPDVTEIALTISPRRSIQGQTLEVIARDSFYEVIYEPIIRTKVNTIDAVYLKNLRNENAPINEAEDVYFIEDTKNNFIFEINVSKYNDIEVDSHIQTVLNSFTLKNND